MLSHIRIRYQMDCAAGFVTTTNNKTSEVTDREYGEEKCDEVD